LENTVENTEQIWKIQKTIVKSHFSSIFSKLFHYSNYLFSIFSKSFHYFLPYLPYHFTIPSWIVIRFGKYSRKYWTDLENTEENSEKIGKIQTKIVNRYGKYGFHIFQIISLLKLFFFHIFQIFSLFSFIFSISFHNFLLYFPNLFTIQLTFVPYFPYLFNRKYGRK
jgi:hypothetical protein